jgi:MFS family permease
VIGASGAALGLILGGALTEILDWRWTLFVNLILAVPTAVVALRLLDDDVVSENRSAIDLPGTLTASAGLFALVYGFSNAESHGWGSPSQSPRSQSVAGLSRSFAASSAASSTRCSRCALSADAARAGGSSRSPSSAPGCSASSCSSRTTCSRPWASRRWAPAWPSCRCWRAHADGAIGQTRLCRASARGRSSPPACCSAPRDAHVHRCRRGHELRGRRAAGLLVLGVGLGLVFGTAMETATRGVEGTDAGVASALVNTGQQVGGSIGTALLSTLAASASGATRRRTGGADVAAQSAVHGYTAAFTWAAAVFAVGSIAAWLLLPSEGRRPRSTRSRCSPTEQTIGP